ncbi:MAG: AAA family ATPase [Gemmatimonadota bacterium]|nr:AAA family ATPase [Gemmatimonadota bacterium]
MSAENGIGNETVEARPGALELGRIIEALTAGQTPDPADVDAVRSLNPTAAGSGAHLEAIRSRLPAIMEDLQPGVDPNRQAAAWNQINECKQIAPLLTGDPADRLDAFSEHAANPPPVSWLVKDWMPDATLTVLTGAGGAGKSRIALQLAVAVATGAERFIEPKDDRRRPIPPDKLEAPSVVQIGGPAPVVFAAWETRRLAFANRLATICGPPGQERAAALERLTGRLHYVNMRPSGGLWGAAPGRHTSTTGAWLSGGDALRAYAERAGARLLIIDPLAAAFVANENDRALVRAFLSGLDQWAEDNGCAVLIISHPPKNDSAQSGSTDWRNGVQAVWELAPADKNATDGTRRLHVDKLNEGPIPKAVRVDYQAGRFVEANDPDGGDSQSQGKTKGEGYANNV